MNRVWRASVCAGIACVVFAVMQAQGGEKDPEMLRRLDEWEHAALNRELAAATQMLQHETALKQAQALRTLEYGEPGQRRTNLNRAGDLEMQAAGTAAAAMGNYDRAADNWEKVAKDFGALGDKKGAADAREMAALARSNATQSLLAAAEAYELASDAYSTQNAGQPGKAAGASERAATWREKLATRNM